MRCESKPGLEDKCNNACPVEEEAHLYLHHHVVKSDMVDDERKGVHERKNKKGVGDPSVKHLKLLMRNPSQKGDPTCLCGSGTIKRKVSLRQRTSVVWEAHKINGMQARAIQPDLVPNGGEPPKSRLGQ